MSVRKIASDSERQTKEQIEMLQDRLDSIPDYSPGRFPLIAQIADLRANLDGIKRFKKMVAPARKLKRI